MGLYLYCIAPSGSEPPAGLAGVDGTEILTVAAGPFAVWASVAGGPPEPNLERIREHHRVVACAVRARPALPLRFGQWSETAAGVSEAVVARREQHERALDLVADAVELGLRVFDSDATPAPEPPAGGSGRDYLEALRRRHAAERARREHAGVLTVEIRVALADLVRAERLESPPARRALLGVAHLVGSDRVVEYRRRVDALRQRFPALRWLVTGPWPPYSFVA